MERAVIYGATGTGKNVYEKIKDKYDVIYFVDEDPMRKGEILYGKKVCDREQLFLERPDVIIMGIITGYNEIVNQLVKDGFYERNIICDFVDLQYRARKVFLENIATILKEKKEGNVAELGVYRGDFAKIINEVFPNRKLYLFDTFEGFPESDWNYERNHKLLKHEGGKMNNTSVEYVLGKMLYPEQCIVKKGYFPETANGLEDEFIFVNIDTDLYKPILAGLEYFWPRMIEGGYILIHDYFSLTYTGAKKAVDEFAQRNGLGFTPIGDTLSVAFVKHNGN